MDELITKSFAPYLKKLIIDQVEYNEKTGMRLLPKEELIKQKMQAVMDQIDKEIANLSDAIQSGFEAIQEILPGMVSKEEWEVIQEESASAGQKIMNEEVSLFTEKEEEDEPIIMAEVLGLREETIEHFYEVSRELHKQKRYQDAANVLKIVTFLYPFDAVFWFGLGLAECHLQNYRQSLQAHAMASLLDEEMIEPIISSAYIYIKLKQYGEAEEELAAIEEVLEKIEDTEGWKAQADRLRQQIQTLERG